MSLIGDISENIIEVNRMENILASKDYSETPDQRQEIMNNIAALRQELESRRKALNELEAKLKESNGYTAKLKKTIDAQKQLIDEQTLKIQELQTQLDEANVRIAGLTENVDSLSHQVTEVTAQREAETRRAEAIADEMNTCYYVCGSNKELKEHKILEKKFLGKTKIMEGDYDRNYFTKADKRTLHTIKTYAKEAKLMTKHPEGSYSIKEEKRDGSRANPQFQIILGKIQFLGNPNRQLAFTAKPLPTGEPFQFACFVCLAKRFRTHRSKRNQSQLELPLLWHSNPYPFSFAANTESLNKISCASEEQFQASLIVLLSICNLWIR